MQIENLSFYTLSSKQLSKKSGIYKLSVGGHIYIGSSKNLYSRLREHKHDLETNSHSNDFLQKVVNKHGINNVNVSVIEFCDPKDRIVREKYWIDELKADINLKDPITFELSESSKEKFSKSIRKGLSEGKYKKPEESSEIERYDLFGKFIKKYSSLEEASKDTGMSIKDIRDCASNYKKGRIRHGNRFRYSISKVPVQDFHFNEKYVGKYFSFNYIDENGEEKFAFNDCRDVWKFFGNLINNKNPEKIILIPKLKNLVNLGNPRTGNHNPSTSEME